MCALERERSQLLRQSFVFILYTRIKIEKHYGLLLKCECYVSIADILLSYKLLQYRTLSCVSTPVVHTGSLLQPGDKLQGADSSSELCVP